MLRRLLIVAVIVVCAGFACAQTVLPSAQVGVLYRVQLGAAVSGTYPFTFTNAGTALPAWLHLTKTGLLEGTPGAGDVTSKAIPISVQITDALNNTAGPFAFSIAVSTEAPAPLVFIAGGSKQAQAPAQANSEKPAAGAQAQPADATAPATQPKAADTTPQPQAAQISDTKTSAPKTPDQPGAPWLHEPLNDGDDNVTGQAEPLATVVLVRRRLSGQHSDVFPVQANPNGEFSVPVTLAKGDEIEIHQIVNGVSGKELHRIVTPYFRNGEEMRAILGYQQAGASAAKSEQNFFMDFYISRPLAFRKRYSDLSQTRLRWWGNVRIASYPQQGDIPVATFASSFVTQFGQLKVNQLAQSAEYLTGLDVRLLSSQFNFLGRSEETRQHFTLSLFGGAGATGPMEPNSTLHVFEVPVPGSPQRPAFDKDFPGVTTPLIGFVSPDRDSCLRQYLVGLRLTTTYMDKYARFPLIAAPASLSVSMGQNELVTRGKLQGMVLRTEAFYPLPFANRSQDLRGMLSALYLFGTSQIHLGRSRNLTPLILNLSTVSGSDPTVTIRTVPSNRDIYRIGFGIDLVHAITSLHSATAAPGTTKATPATTPPVPGVTAPAVVQNQ